jgi:hypothetical protein
VASPRAPSAPPSPPLPTLPIKGRACYGEHIGPAPALFKPRPKCTAAACKGDADMAELGLDFDLGEMADAIRETTRRFADDKIAPIAAKIDEEDWFPRELWPQMGELGPARDHRRGGGWRARARLSRACRRAGGGGAGVGLDRAQLRRAFEPLRQPDPPLGEPEQKAKYLPKLISGEHVGASPCPRPARAPTWSR